MLDHCQIERTEFMNKIIVFLTILGLVGCATPGQKRVFLDSSLHSDDPPKWVKSTKLIWNDDGKMFLKSSHIVRGDERTNGCFDLSKMNAKENLLSELANDVKGSIDNAQQSINENAEEVLGKVRSGQFEGRITGLRFSEEYFERYKIGEVERIDCFTLAEMKLSDYENLKRMVVNKIQAVDSRLKEAITKKQINFFGDSSKPEKAEQ